MNEASESNSKTVKKSSSSQNSGMDFDIRSKSISKVVAAFCKAWVEIHNPKKNAKNPFFKSSYATLEEHLNVAREALSKHGLAPTQPGTKRIDGVTHLATVIMHGPSGELIGGYYPVTPTKEDPQAVGSSVTYSRRYALAAILGIAGEDDDDAESAMSRGEQSNQGRALRRQLPSEFLGENQGA